MNLTQYLIFEIGTECNLGALHPKCPNRHPGRYGKLPTTRSVSNERFAEIADVMYNCEGFRGRIGFHYYNEPLVSIGRMWLLMNMITNRVPEARYTLWTNGTLLPEDCSQFARFEEIHVTDYGLADHPVRNSARLFAAQPKTQIQRVRLDDRLNAIGEDHSEKPCHRMFTEFIIDYWGNVHLCCYDWAGQGSIGNIHTEGLQELVTRWQHARGRMAGEWMIPSAPESCFRCKMRSTYIPQFVPEIAADAKRYIESGGHHGT